MYTYHFKPLRGWMGIFWDAKFLSLWPNKKMGIISRVPCRVAHTWGSAVRVKWGLLKEWVLLLVLGPGWSFLKEVVVDGFWVIYSLYNVSAGSIPEKIQGREWGVITLSIYFILSFSPFMIFCCPGTIFHWNKYHIQSEKLESLAQRM